ncbi:MAG: hypothetical protein K0Q50_2315 [Vampirovibrio sp.]|nr:hypothetical protein [Vampirovibrio sp.]
MMKRAPYVWVIAACFCLAQAGNGSVAYAMPGANTRPPLPGPPVPQQYQEPVLKHLTMIESVNLDRGNLRIMAANGERLVLKNRFVLSNPSRLIIDIADATLGKAGLPFPPPDIDGVPVHGIRFGQFTEDTVRIVIETQEPERFQVAMTGRDIAVSAARQNLVSGLYKHVFGRNEPPRDVPQPVAALPASRANAVPVGPAPARPYSPGPNLSGSNLSASTMPPQLNNLRRLSMEQSGFMAGMPNRNRILEIARTQVGLSKDADPDYVIQAFSQGKDQSWCADFISTVLDWAGGSPWGHLSRVQDIYDWGIANRQLLNQPEPASVVIFSNDGKTLNHIAFVEAINPDNTITTIGGNEGYASGISKSGAVTRSVYNLADSRIRAFVNPAFPANITNSSARMPEAPLRF